MKFRQHRGGREESMKTVVEIEPTQKAVLDAVKDSLYPVTTIKEEDIKSLPYFVDPFLGPVYMIICTLGVLGFSDVPLEIPS